MGVLGWTSDETLGTLLVDIEMALNSRYRFAQTILEAIYGPAKSKPKVSAQPMTPALFRSLFGG